ncbi:hypothetical protein SynBIOSU31_01279 [Synechococcus sp. BIOS-U3-1]|nr:hypothetical protein SynBIOSU31_01279 [Synechococcus sp. BIOS-U3-1]
MVLHLFPKALPNVFQALADLSTNLFHHWACADEATVSSSEFLHRKLLIGALRDE